MPATGSSVHKNDYLYLINLLNKKIGIYHTDDPLKYRNGGSAIDVTLPNEREIFVPFGWRLP
uniref:Uncharacterized protein n=1 Tax=Romanomermis culicivorax TaxID=13658 RepID=A0A915K796_ROMCU